MKKLLSSKSSIEESRVKIVLVGDKNVGKTNFLIRYRNTISHPAPYFTLK
jgi:GTPase SAR1 family protein